MTDKRHSGLEGLLEELFPVEAQLASLLEKRAKLVNRRRRDAAFGEIRFADEARLVEERLRELEGDRARLHEALVDCARELVRQYSAAQAQCFADWVENEILSSIRAVGYDGPAGEACLARYVHDRLHEAGSGVVERLDRLVSG